MVETSFSKTKRTNVFIFNMAFFAFAKLQDFNRNLIQIFKKRYVSKKKKFVMVLVHFKETVKHKKKKENVTKVMFQIYVKKKCPTC